MIFVKNFCLLYEAKSWSLVILFITYFSLAHSDTNYLGKIKNDQNGKTDDVEKIEAHFPKSLLIESKCKLVAYDIENFESFKDFQLTTSQLGSCTFDLYLNNTIYTNYRGSIMSTPSLKTELQVPANYNHGKRGSHTIYDIAVDFINKKLYIITVDNKQESDKLMVVDIVSGYTAIVMTDLHLPNRIEVDPSEGLLFIQQQESIFKANMDGTLRKEIVKKNGVSNFAIDRKSKSIYWVTPPGIKKSDYHGISPRLVVPVSRPIQSLAVHENQVFWISTPYSFLEPNSTVSHCKLKIFSPCDKKSIRTIRFHDPQTVKTYDFAEIENFVREKSNPCDNIEPRCQHLCLLKKNGYSCACQVGYRLNSDMHTCRLANEEFLLYVQDNYAKGRIIGFETNNSVNFVDAFYPNGLVSTAKFVSFDYDYESNSIFFTDNASDENKLYMKRLHSEYEQITLYSYNREVHSTAFDWISKNIYQLVSDRSKRHQYSIIIHHYSLIAIREGKHIKHSTELIVLPNNWEAGDMVIHPLRGVMFIAVRSDTFQYGRVYQANLDGSNLTVYLTDTSLSGMAIDFKQKVLYRIYIDKNILVRVDLDNPTRSEWFDISVVKDATSVSVSNTHIYVGNLTTVWRFDKMTMKNPLKVIESADINHPRTIIGTKLYGPSAQPISAVNPCTYKNGGCQKFCFAVPQPHSDNDELLKQCGCEKDEILKFDRVSCRSTKNNATST